MEKITSFTIDHIKLQPGVYVSRKDPVGNSVITTFDIRMITRGSIEEQVVKLGARKREMFDQMITAGEAMPTQLTPEDIRALFD